MAGAGKKWLMGCGIGCGLVLISLGGIGTCGYFGFQKIKEGADRIEVTVGEMEARFGQIEDYTPQVDGRIPAATMEVFLAARDGMAAERESMSAMFRTLEEDGGGNVIAKIKAGLRFIPSMIVFVEQRNQALLNEGMGLGEYYHIYTLAYHNMLDKDLGDGPSFDIEGDDEEESESPVRFGVRTNDGDDGARERRQRRRREFVNRTQRRILANQLQALDSLDAAALSMGGLSGLDRDTWRATLAAEVEAMRNEHLRLPWEEGLPPQIRASLEPYRDRLEASYDEMTAVLEMGMGDNDHDLN